MEKSEIAEIINQYLKNGDLSYVYDNEKYRFKFGLNTHERQIKMLSYHILVSDNSYSVLVICPIGVEADNKELMAQMNEYLCRANYDLRNGNFEFDFRDGEIRYKSFVDVQDSPLTKEVFRNSISVPAAMYRRYGSGIVNVLYGYKSPKDAIEEAEADPTIAKRVAPVDDGGDKVIKSILEGLDGDDD